MQNQEIPVNESRIHPYVSAQFDKYFFLPSKFSFMGITDKDVPEFPEVFPLSKRAPYVQLEALDVFSYVKEWCDRNKNYPKFRSPRFWEFINQKTSDLKGLNNWPPEYSEVCSRLMFVADSTLSDNERRELVKHLGLEMEKFGGSPEERSIRIYGALERKLGKMKQHLGKAELDACLRDSEHDIDPRVYMQYRGGGFERGRPNIEAYDKATWLLFRKGALYITKDGRRIERDGNNHQLDAVFTYCDELCDSWNKGRQDVPTEF